MGRGSTRSATDVMMPSVPSEPHHNRIRSYPVTFFTTRPPAFTSSPSARSTVIPRTKSRGRPCRVRSGPPIPTASTPPSVACSACGGSIGRRWPALASCTPSSPSVTPVGTTAVRSAGSCSTSPASAARTSSSANGPRGAPPSPSCVRPAAGTRVRPSRSATTTRSSSRLAGATTASGARPATRNGACVASSDIGVRPRRRQRPLLVRHLAAAPLPRAGSCRG